MKEFLQILEHVWSRRLEKLFVQSSPKPTSLDDVLLQTLLQATQLPSINTPRTRTRASHSMGPVIALHRAVSSRHLHPAPSHPMPRALLVDHAAARRRSRSRMTRSTLSKA